MVFFIYEPEHIVIFSNVHQCTFNRKNVPFQSIINPEWNLVPLIFTEAKLGGASAKSLSLILGLQLIIITIY